MQQVAIFVHFIQRKSLLPSPAFNRTRADAVFYILCPVTQPSPFCSLTGMKLAIPPPQPRLPPNPKARGGLGLDLPGQRPAPAAVGDAQAAPPHPSVDPQGQRQEANREPDRSPIPRTPRGHRQSTTVDTANCSATRTHRRGAVQSTSPTSQPIADKTFTPYLSAIRV